MIYTISPYVSSYNHYFGTETFAAFALIIFFYFFFLFLSTSHLKKIFLAGLFTCWLIFLKPIGIIFIIIIPIYIGIYCIKGIFKKSFLFWITASAIYVSSFLFFDTIWTIRNKNQFNTFTPLTSAFQSNSNDLELKKFFMATGLSFQSFTGKDHLAWFAYRNGNSKFNETFSNSDPFPSWIYTTKYNFDSLKNLRSIYWSAAISEDPKQRELLNEKFKNTVSAYTLSFKKEHPFHSAITVNLVFLKKLFFIEAAYNIPLTGQSIFQKVIRILYVLFYYFIIVGFLLFSCMFFFSKYKAEKMMGSMLVICWGFVLSLVFLGAIENRYLVPIYPLILFMAVLFYNDFIAVFQKYFKKVSV
jgi:hypothetical protein